MSEIDDPFRARAAYDKQRNEAVDAVAAQARVEPSAEELAERARLAAIEEARRRLIATDWIAVKAAETGLQLTNEWRAWRATLRDIAGGDAPGPVPPEPAVRWA